jgi:urease accessory protein
MKEGSAVGAMALLLADARLPSGSHAHSGGIEQAVDLEVVTDLDSLVPFLHGRLLTAGRLGAHVAACSCALAARDESWRAEPWKSLDDEVSARIVAPALRATSRRQGRALLRTGMTILEEVRLAIVNESAPDGPHLAVVQGAVAHYGGLGPDDAALIAAYGTIASAASAALRLLGLDPLSVAGALVRLAPEIDGITAEAGAAAHLEPRFLPSLSSPLSDLLGERHAARKERLFAS